MEKNLISRSYTNRKILFIIEKIEFNCKKNC